MFLGKMLAWSGTGAGIDGKDAGKMEVSAERGQSREDGRLHWGLEQLGARMPMLTWGVSILGTSSSAQSLPGSSAVARPHRLQVEEPSMVFVPSSSVTALLNSPVRR